MNARHVDLYETVLRSAKPTARLRDLVQVLLDSGSLTADSALAELEELRGILVGQDRDGDEDVVLEVMDFLVGWCSPHMRINSDRARFRVEHIRPGTAAAVWTDRAAAARVRDQYFPPTAQESPRVVVVDLTGYWVTPGVLEELLVPVGKGIRSNIYGPLTVVVRTHDPSVAHFVELLAGRHRLPIYVALADPTDLSLEPKPAGLLTDTDVQTLEGISQLGGQVTSPEYARFAGIGVTAAGNRLSRLVQEHLIFRFSEPGKKADMYVDPRKYLQPSH